MHPYSISFQASDYLIFKIISILLSLFIVGTWLYNSNHIKFIWRSIFTLLSAFASYYIVVFFFGIIQFSYITVKDNFNPKKQFATIIKYEIHLSKSISKSPSRTRRNTFYKPLLEYKEKNGSLKRTFGDISFSKNNKKALGEKVEIILENKEVRMVSPIKTFTLSVNIVMLCFLFLFYYIFYNYAKTQNFEKIGTIAFAIFGYIIFPIAFVILIYLFLNIGFEYFFLHKRYTSRNSAILLSVLGIFFALCFFSYIKILIESIFKNSKKNKLKKR